MRLTYSLARTRGRSIPPSDHRRSQDARIAVKWLVRLERERARPACHWMRQRDDAVAAALAWWVLALRLGGCRHGRHYAREIRDTAIRDGLVIDTGCVDKPSRQTSRLRSRWWPIYIVMAEFKGKNSWHGHPSYWSSQPAAPVIASLCSDAMRKVFRRNWNPAYGSVQAAFKATGPP